MKWYAISVCPQQEKGAVKSLAARKVEAFTPIEIIRHYRSNRWMEVERAAIIGYVFIRVSEIPWGDLKEIRHIRGVVGFGGPIAIPDGDVEILKKWSGLQRNPFEAGDQVQMINGPWKGDSITVGKIVGDRVCMIRKILGAMREIDVPIKYLMAG